MTYRKDDKNLNLHLDIPLCIYCCCSLHCIIVNIYNILRSQVSIYFFKIQNYFNLKAKLSSYFSNDLVRSHIYVYVTQKWHLQTKTILSKYSMQSHIPVFHNCLFNQKPEAEVDKEAFLTVLEIRLFVHELMLPHQTHWGSDLGRSDWGITAANGKAAMGKKGANPPSKESITALTDINPNIVWNTSTSIFACIFTTKNTTNKACLYLNLAQITLSYIWQ